MPEERNQVSTSAACSQALALPEIVAAILEKLHHTKALFAALRVNRLWADEATRILWRVDPPVWGLVQISNVERRQYYANQVLSLNLDEPDSCELDQLLNTRFPRLTKLSSLHLHERQQQYLYHFLQPTLRSFGCIGYGLRLELLLQIAAQCPDLPKPSLGWMQGPLLLRDLFRFLDLMPSLTHISLHYVGDADLYLHLASRPNLQELRISGPTLTEDATVRMLATVTNPYPKLRRLRWPTHGKAFRCLARHLSSLNVLELTLVDTSDDIFFAISDCTNLETIHVTVATDSHVPAEGLLAVARKCSHLRVFDLLSTPITKVDGRSITDDIIRQVATYLPTMTCFRLDIQTNLTVMALLYLGDRCTKLTECHLQGDFNLEQLGRLNSAPLFPQLKGLMLHRISKNVPYERAVSILLQNCPHLRLSKGCSRETWDRIIYHSC